ncbi:ABC transporter ATP-binding protein [Alphaproteobacteria bacterium LSUCC0684]
MAEIRIKNLRKEFGDFTAVQSSSFKVEDGEFFMLLGPSGCGKTTTLRMIAGLELPTSGEITIDGEDVSQMPASQRDIAFVFQMFALYPHMNVRKNISYPLTSQGMSRDEVQRKVAEVAATLEIENLLDQPVSGLSGGDRQRVALGRAIVRSPKCFLMDEPLGALDAEFREHMAEELRKLHDRMGATTVYVTHDQLEAMQMGDKIVVMNHGVIEQFGTPQQIYDTPMTMFVAQFIGSPPMNFLDFEAELETGASTVSLHEEAFKVPQLHQTCAGKLVFGVRPEHVRLSDSTRYRGEITATEYLGTTQIVTLNTPNGEVKARIASDQVARVGEQVGLVFEDSKITLFDRPSGHAIRSALNEGVKSHG